MKPRPMSAVLTLPLRPIRQTASIQCRRNVYNHAAAASTLNRHHWHSGPRSRAASMTPHLLSRRSHATKHAPPKTLPARPPRAFPTITPKPDPHDSKAHPSPDTTSKSLATSHDQLNPPVSTYAPELVLPPKIPGQNKLKWLFHTGKAYLAFYKSGIANVRHTNKLARTLRSSAKARLSASSSEGKIPRGPADVLSRAEWQITRRSTRDMLRLLPFGALVLVLGEWMPLIALYLTPIIPEPCRIPKQVTKELEKKETARRKRKEKLLASSFRMLPRHHSPPPSSSSSSSSAANPQIAKDPMAPWTRAPASYTPEQVSRLGHWGLWALGVRLDAYSRIWDFGGANFAPPKWVLRWGVGRKLAYLKEDDRLIGRDGGWKGLSRREVERACVERGIDVLGRGEGELKKALKAWGEAGGEDKRR
ncbi:hypothetical protein BS50DRAFT_577708 [Corynespora cassiicola Philippines]|uniref:Letm1 RBD domain-containing protein n=1 Tax=Corynespora cassiicola Philippines TaxID=1448308 RepID=A0A2T2NBQ6_CORCC|nr:hypothetical protein BS50DRAFT_577708 [Corynespora cassiicola Philippines]